MLYEFKNDYNKLVMSTWVIGDIHGCFLTLKSLFEDKIHLSKEDTVYLLGDMIDRGKRSKETLDYIISLQQQGYTILPIKGNHEDLLIRLYHEKREDFVLFKYPRSNSYRRWVLCGGKHTLESFQVEKAHNIPYHYIQWMESLPYYHVLEDYILVHAGLDFSEKDPFANTTAMLTFKKMTIIPARIDNKIIIHGHTKCPIKRIKQMIEQRHYDHRINLDNGCILVGKQGYGSLLALNLENMTLTIQENID